MTTNHGDTETAAREALTNAVRQAIEDFYNIANNAGDPHPTETDELKRIEELSCEYAEKLERSLAALTVALSARPTAPDAVAAEWQATHRHVKRGSTYQLIGHAELQSSTDVFEGADLTVYRAEDGRLWARPRDEFEDGRFEALRPTTQTTETEVNDGR